MCHGIFLSVPATSVLDMPKGGPEKKAEPQSQPKPLLKFLEETSNAFSMFFLPQPHFFMGAPQNMDVIHEKKCVHRVVKYTKLF